MADWLPVIAVAMVAAAYTTVIVRSDRPVRASRLPPLAFAGGVATTAVAIAPPFHAVAERSFTGHMVQHVLLIAVAAPLLVLGHPGSVLLRSLPPDTRRRWGAAARARRQSARRDAWAPWAAIAVAVQAGVMWAWHAPVLFEAALRSDAVHGIEHVTLLASSILVWWAVQRGRRARRGAAALALFVAAFPGTALGAALLLAPRPWFPSYAHHGAATALADQQMAGVVMWSVAGIAYVVGAAVLFGTWLGRETQANVPRPKALGAEGDSYAY